MTSRWIILLFALQLTAAKLTGETETDVDDGQDWDIFSINEEAGLDLLEGDIEMDELDGRNSIIGDKYRWPRTVPYYLEDSLEMNAKGVILKAFDQYRLKTCIDFTPWKGEENYISVYKGSGCFSSVGNRRVGKQRLSIGKNCDRLGTVEHELLHALGFWHEQSRADRDDYVNIMWDRVEAGKEHNFKTYDDTVSSALNVPYDYGSVMHYSKTAFNVGSEPTIVTKIPQFMDVIGQRMEFSDSDLLKLNRLYNCTTSSTFVDTCDFEEENICGMIQGPGNAKWARRSNVTRGPQTDFTNMGKGKGYFMHFNTASGEAGDSASLESRILYLKPGAQCLQFFLYNSGAADDHLNIWVREYDNHNPSGSLKLVKSISGGVRGSWELHHVNLDVRKKSRVVFEGVKGKTVSTGGLSLDDINLSSTSCPQHVWHIRNITALLATTAAGIQVYSPRFLSPGGYSFQVGTYLNGLPGQPDYMAIYFYLTSGPNDETLKWPCPWQQATMALMDQQPDIRKQMSMHRMITTDPNKLSSDGKEYYYYSWDNPRKVGSLVHDPDGSSYYRGPGTGTSVFITHSRLRSRNFIKGDDAFFLFSLKDISELLIPQPLPRSAVHGDDYLVKGAAKELPQGTTTNPTVMIVVTVSVAAAILVLAMLMGVGAWRSRGRRQQETDQIVIIEDMPEFLELSENPPKDSPSTFITP